MKIIQEVVLELFNMFMADARMTMATLVMVAIAAAFLNFTNVNSFWIGAALLIGCLANVVAAAAREKRTRDRK